MNISVILTVWQQDVDQKRSELPFSAAYNLFWNICLSNGSEGASGWQLSHMGPLMLRWYS